MIGPIVYDDRRFGGNLSKQLGLEPLTPKEQQEYDDATVLRDYFGLSVWIQDRQGGDVHEAKSPPRADYLVGLFEAYPSARWPGTAMDLVAATPMDLYAPDAGTSEGTIEKEVRDKAKTQAPVVVIDMTDNKFLQGQYQSGTLDNWSARRFGPQRNVTVPERVIYINNEAVVYDYNPGTGFGPAPANVA